MILITGGAGYIGSHVNKELNRRGYQTLVYDNLSRGHRELARWGTLIEGDLCDSQKLRDLFERHPVRAVLHFAAFAYVGESVGNPADYYRNNVANTLNLLEAMRTAGVAKMVFSSTCATYGVPQATPIAENHPQHPINPYGRGKLFVEGMLRDFSEAYGLSFAALRYFNAAGADPDGEVGEWHEPETHLIPLALAAAAGEIPSLSVLGTDYDTPDGTCIRDYIHVSDLATAHVLALEHLLAGKGSLALNLGNGAGYSVSEVIAAVERVTGRTVPVTLSPRRPGDPPALVGSAARALEVLGWTPTRNIDEIMATAWRWYQNRPDRGAADRSRQ